MPKRIEYIISYLTYFILTIAIFIGCTQTKSKYPQIKIETRLGDIVVELYPEKAPKTVTAFLANIDAHIYDNTSFYRILSRENQATDAYKLELIQGGTWNTKSKSIERPNIPHETTQLTGIKHTDGVISMARLEPGTASTEFFICIGDQSGLDYGSENNPDKQGYAAFGKVIKGMETVLKIYNRPETDQHFDTPIDIYTIKKL